MMVARASTWELISSPLVARVTVVAQVCATPIACIILGGPKALYLVRSCGAVGRWALGHRFRQQSAAFSFFAFFA